MAKVVFLGFPFKGHVNTSLGLVKEMSERGEEIYYYSTAETKNRIEAAGANFRSYRILEGWSSKTEADKIIERLSKSGSTRIVDSGEAEASVEEELELAKAVEKDIMDEVKALNPEYIVFDAGQLWGKAIAQTLGIPGIAYFTTFAYSHRIFLRDSKYALKHIFKLSGEQIEALSEEQEIEYGVQSRKIQQVYGSEQLNIVFTSKEFHPFGDLFKDNYKFVGYSIDKRDECLDFRLDKSGNDLKTIYISLGSILSNHESYIEFYKACFEAFKGNEYQVVMTIGENNLEKLGDTPDNFVIRSFVPQLEILKHTDVFITHGGHGSVSESLCHGVPMVVIPQVNDQMMIADRVESLNLGVCLNKGEVNSCSLTEAVRKILKDTLISQNCKRMSADLKNSGGCSQAAEEIFKLKAALNSSI